MRRDRPSDERGIRRGDGVVKRFYCGISRITGAIEAVEHRFESVGRLDGSGSARSRLFDRLEATVRVSDTEPEVAAVVSLAGITAHGRGGPGTLEEARESGADSGDRGRRNCAALDRPEVVEPVPPANSNEEPSSQ